jgi:hypothetical protein
LLALLARFKVTALASLGLGDRVIALALLGLGDRVTALASQRLRLVLRPGLGDKGTS